MPAITPFGTNTNARKKRVYYSSSSTIYEGMPVCYDYDATTNILGYDKAAGGDVTCQSSPSTTAEGYQNEGKFLRVEDVGNDGIMCFAGVVAGTSHAGLTGPRWLDIYIPNGAIVPVRSGIATTRAQTVFGIASGSDAFETALYNTRSAHCAIAMETVDRATDEGLCLAQLFHPLFFNRGSQDQDYEDFKVGVGTSSGDVQCMKEYWSIWSTGGTFKTRMWRTDVRADGCSCPYGGMIAAQLRLFAASDAQGGNVTNTYITTEFASGSTIGAGVGVKNLYLRLYDEGATMTSGGEHICNIYMENKIDSSSGENYQIYSNVHGSDALDAFIAAPNNKSLAAEACGATTKTWDGSDIAIKILVGSTPYYIYASDSNS